VNYRHHYHAGNFADVVKHLIVLALVEAMRRKPKGFFLLDTHAGRGAYDLAMADQGDSLERKPEWPDGLGRLRQTVDRPELVQRYLDAVEGFAGSQIFPGANPYPGSPCLVAAQLREQDRATWCELQSGEFQLLRDILVCRRGWRVEERDGYEAVRGCLPPVERRALVLIDPPYEAGDESDQVWAALLEGLRRLPGGTFAIWYPLTARVGDPVFVRRAASENLPPSWTAELTVAGVDSSLKMRGAGVMVVNPPWQLDQTLAPTMHWLGQHLAQGVGGAGILRWLVPER
jgi:23S rRNA (adenine2030-N6)-methyltransferase